MKGILFDMDGILIDSEPFWRQAEIDIFGRVGLPLTEAECFQTMGLRIDEVVAIRYAQKPWTELSQKEVADLILEQVENLVRQQGEPLPGVEAALACARDSGLPVGLASSSSYRLIEATLEALGVKKYFGVIHSAEEEEWGKPHPAVYLRAAAKLGVAPTACLAIEDSLNGVIAAKAARMAVVAIPEAQAPEDPRFVLADHRLADLAEFPQLLGRLLA